MIILDILEYLLEIDGLDDEDRDETVKTIINSSAITALFYSNSDKLQVKPWW